MQSSRWVLTYTHDSNNYEISDRNQNIYLIIVVLRIIQWKRMIKIVTKQPCLHNFHITILYILVYILNLYHFAKLFIQAIRQIIFLNIFRFKVMLLIVLDFWAMIISIQNVYQNVTHIYLKTHVLCEIQQFFCYTRNRIKTLAP